MFAPIIIDENSIRQFPCSRLSKRPLIKGWPEVASSDPAQLAEWFKTFPAAVAGLLCENFTCLDVDDLGWLQQYEHQLPTTRVHYTPRGRHYLWKLVPNLKSSTGRIGPGVDIKTGPRSFIIFHGHRVIDARLAPFPAELLQELSCDVPRTSPWGNGAAGAVMVRSCRGSAGTLSQGNGIGDEEECSLLRVQAQPALMTLLCLDPQSGSISSHPQPSTFDVAPNASCGLLNGRCRAPATGSCSGQRAHCATL